MSDNPTITVVLPVHNGQRYLSEALDAILAQTFTDFELVIVDDCSTDASPQIMEEYAARDARIRIIHNEVNLKLPASLNVGHRAGRGALFTWTSDDNNPHPDWLERLATVLTDNCADIVYSNYTGIDESGHVWLPITDLPSLSQLLWQNTVGASFLYTRHVFESLHGYDTGLFLVEDYDFWVRAYLYGFKFFKIETSLYDYRRHDEALSCSVPQDGVSVPYRFGIRKQFKNASSEEIFKSRTTLLYNGRHILPKYTLFLLFCESLAANPMKTVMALCTRAYEFFK